MRNLVETRNQQAMQRKKNTISLVVVVVLNPVET